MNNLEILIVRACFTPDPQVRLRSVYRRFYVNDDRLYRKNIRIILAKIIDKYFPVSLTKYLTAFADVNFTYEFFNPDKSEDSFVNRYSEIVLRCLIGHIRSLETDKILDVGFKPSLKYRNLSKTIKYGVN